MDGHFPFLPPLLDKEEFFCRSGSLAVAAAAVPEAGGCQGPAPGDSGSPLDGFIAESPTDICSGLV